MRNSNNLFVVFTHSFFFFIHSFPNNLYFVLKSDETQGFFLYRAELNFLVHFKTY